MPKRAYLLFSFATVLLAANLRASIIVVGPLVETIGDAIGVSPTVMGLIGTLPVLTFAIISPFSAKLAQRFGLESVILGGLVLIALGGLLRSLLAQAWLVMLGTVVMCIGITMGNVLLAAAIKRDYPEYISRLTALQMLSFSLFSAMSAALAVPIAKLIGWQWALGCWSLLTVPAFVLWFRIRRVQKGGAALKIVQRPQGLNVWKSPLAWRISLYTGLQSLLFYTLVAWLATIITARGFSAEQAGYYNTLFQLVALPTSMLLPLLTDKYRDMRYLLVATASLIFVGIAGVWFGTTSLMWLFTLILGVGGCASFTLCLMLFALRGKNAVQSAALSGMGQTVGYSVAALGPLCAGLLFEYHNDWQMPIIAMLAVALVQIMLGWYAGKSGDL